jgi:hypothetical protein
MVPGMAAEVCAAKLQFFLQLLVQFFWRGVQNVFFLGELSGKQRELVSSSKPLGFFPCDFTLPQVNTENNRHLPERSLPMGPILARVKKSQLVPLKTMPTVFQALCCVPGVEAVINKPSSVFMEAPRLGGTSNI